MNRKLRFVILIVLALTVLVTAGYFLRLDRFGIGYEIDYVDCVKINNQLYTSGLNPSNRTLIESSMIDQKIGEVKFTLQDNVHSPYYLNRNGDAAFLEKGTGIFSLKSQSDAVAVKIGEQYYIFKNDPRGD